MKYFEKQVIGSTAAALLHYESLMVFLWAGDSRIYRLREGSLSLMTVDHNLAQERVCEAKSSRKFTISAFLERFNKGWDPSQTASRNEFCSSPVRRSFFNLHRRLVQGAGVLKNRELTANEQVDLALKG